MAFGEFVDHNWGAEVSHDDTHREELADVPQYERSLLARDYSPESFDETVKERQALQAALSKVTIAAGGAANA